MTKKILKTISFFLLLIFSFSSLAAGAQNISSAVVSQMQIDALKTQGAALGNNFNPFNNPLNNPLTLGNKTEISGNNSQIFETSFMSESSQKDFAGSTAAKESDIESYFSKTLSEEAEQYQFKPLQQFGYNIFSQQLAIDMVAPSAPSVSQDYILGPGDNFSITMWGIAEGVYTPQVDNEGNIILPKIGVVHVAGLRYGELQNFIEGQLSRYYEQVKVNVSMKQISGIRVYVVGEVKKPGTYNTTSLATVYNALFLAGGVTKNGSLRNIKVVRAGRTIGQIDFYNFLLYGSRKQDISLISGDTVFVPVIGKVAAVAGNVRRPGIYEIKTGSDLSDVIGMAGGVLPTSYINRVQIERVMAHEKRVMLDKQFNFSESNPRFYVGVQDMDLIKIYPIFSSVSNTVYLDGAVKYPGPYQWREGLSVKDVIASSNDLMMGAYLPKAEVVRRDAKTLETRVITFDLKKLLAGDADQNIALEPADRIVVSSDLRLPRVVSVEGEVRLPGSYVIMEGERISSIIKRAGGYLPDAYLFGAVLRRDSAKEAQDYAYKELIKKIETDLIVKEGEIRGVAQDATDTAVKTQETMRNRQLLEQLKKTLVVEGRVIISLSDLKTLEGSKNDIILEDGDEIIIPRMPNVVNVLGEVYNPSSVVFQQGKTASYYLGKVGGPTSMANSGEIYLLRADGSIVSRRQGYNIQATQLMAGDTVLVPKSFEYFNFWLGVKDFTHWFYEATLAFAVIATYMKK